VIVTVTPNPVLDRTLTVERILFDEVTRATAVQLDWGGKGFNVSRALRALGLESVAMGFVGGATGEVLERGLRELSIGTDFVTINGDTRSNIVVREEGSQRYVKVNEPGPTIQPQEMAGFVARVTGKVQSGDIWVLAGSLPPGLPADFYARLIGIVRERGGRPFLDTSGEPLRLGCAAAPTLVKPNAVEATEMTGCQINSLITEAPDRPPRGSLQAARHFLDLGIEIVALSLGADGLLLASGEEMVWARPPAVQALNPTGAGDALLAGLIFGLVQDLPLEEVARWGVASGTSSAMGQGVGAGTLSEVQSWYRRVETMSAPCWGGR